MLRIILPAVLIILSLSSCDKILKIAQSSNSGSIEDEIQISSQSKPEIITAFKAIAMAMREHNRVFLQNHDAQKPANEISYSAGIDHLSRSAREHGGLTKQIIDAYASTCMYEKSLFTPFDTIQNQMHGMKTWSNNQSTQLRGYIQILDQIIVTYDGAISYLERGEQLMEQKNFDRYKVPAEVSSEFFRLKQLHGKEHARLQLEMFREQRLAFQCNRSAMTTADPIKGNELYNQAQQHEKMAKQFETQMIAEIRKQMENSEI